MGRNFGFFPFFNLMDIWIIIWLLTIVILLPALLRKKSIEKAELNEYEARKEKLVFSLRELEKSFIIAQNDKQDLDYQVLTLANNLERQKDRMLELKAEEARLQNTLNSFADIENKIKNNMEKAIEEKSEMLSKQYQEAEENYIAEYTNTIKDMAQDFEKTMVGKRAELNLIEDAITDKQMIYQAILDCEQRKAQEAAQKDFYRLNIPEEDLKEIEKIKEVIPHLRNPEALNKVIWSVYYQKPYQDLVARLFNSSKPTGIYKITSLIDGKIYIGQSVNVPNRFSEHIKRGLGAEPATKNRLYPTMMKQGVENFTFELLEEIPRDKLDERERYWIEYFKSAEFGLNGNKGVKG